MRRSKEKGKHEEGIFKESCSLQREVEGIESEKRDATPNYNNIEQKGVRLIDSIKKKRFLGGKSSSVYIFFLFNCFHFYFYFYLKKIYLIVLCYKSSVGSFENVVRILNEIILGMFLIYFSTHVMAFTLSRRGDAMMSHYMILKVTT